MNQIARQLGPDFNGVTRAVPERFSCEPSPENQLPAPVAAAEMEAQIRRVVDDAMNSAIPEPWEVSAHAAKRIMALIALSHPAALSGGDSGAEAEVLREELAKEKARADKLDARVNSPETEDWMAGVPLEAAHQIERWGANHDVGKTAMDWFWLIGYLSQKAATSQMAGDLFKAKHHTISTAAALLNWHRHLTGESTEMRPGIDPVARGIAALATAPEGSEKQP